MSEKKHQAYYRFIKDFDSSKDSILITQFKAQKLGLIILGFGFIVFLISMLVFFFTPLKKMAPGFPDQATKREILQIQYKLDSISRYANEQEQYIENIRNILKGENTAISEVTQKKHPNTDTLDINASKTETQFRNHIEEKDKFNTLEPTEKFSKYSFYKPIEGIITDPFNPKIKHYGIDIVSTQNEPIKSIQGGTVVFSGWTSEDGYVISIQHPNNFISTYKHNSSLLKSLGDNVLSGEVIALIGNTGELSQGQHLHIEIWQNGYPVDPEKLINF